jgi:hypothetical protein
MNSTADLYTMKKLIEARESWRNCRVDPALFSADRQNSVSYTFHRIHKLDRAADVPKSGQRKEAVQRYGDSHFCTIPLQLSFERMANASIALVEASLHLLQIKSPSGPFWRSPGHRAKVRTYSSPQLEAGLIRIRLFGIIDRAPLVGC